MAKKINLNNLQRQFLFLSGLVVFGGFAFGISLIFKESIFSADVNKASNLQAQNVRNPVYVEVSADPVNTGSSVLGAGGFCNAEMDFEFQPLCAESYGNYDITGGSVLTSNSNSVNVRENVEITLSELTYPAGLFAGTAEEFLTETELILKERNQIYMGVEKGGNLYVYENIFYPDAGGYLYDGRLYAAPGSDTALEYDEASIKNLSKGYDINVCLDPSGDCAGNLTMVTLEGDIYEEQGEDANPDAYNKNANLLGGSYYAPNVYAGFRRSSVDECEMVDPTSIEGVESSCFIACKAEDKPFSYAKTLVMNLAQWTECLEKKLSGQGGCTEKALVAIRIDGVFGTQANCNEGFCGTKMSDTFNNAVNTPNDERKYTPNGVEESSSEPYAEPFYIKTDCQVSINNGSPVDLPCLWDVSPLKREYERQVLQDAPGEFGDLMPFELYWEMVEEQASAANDCAN